MHPTFENPQIPVEDLPRVADVQWVKLSPKYLEYYYGWVGVSFIFLLLPIVVLFIFTDRWMWITAASAWLLLLLLLLIFARQVYHHKAYALRQHDMLYKRGLIVRRVTTVPYARLQHSKIRESALERAFGLSSLMLYTAGGSNSDLQIPGLLPDEAQKIKDYISRKVEAEEEE